MSIYRNKRVLITGGLGFIGSNLARILVEHGAHVTLVDSLIPDYGGNLFNIHAIKDKCDVNISDVRDPYAMSYLIKGKDYLFNLAGQTSHLDSMLNPKVDLDINAHAQLSILESCREYNPDIKIVFASTRQLYGKPQYLPVDESHPIYPVDVNGINKLAGEWYHILYNNVYGIRSCALRLTNTYGPSMRIKDARQTFLGIWIKQILINEPIKVFGDGNQLRDFNYVDDCISAILAAGEEESSNGKVYNLGSQEVISLKEVANLMTSMVDGATYSLVEFPPDRKKIDIGDYYSDYSLIENELNWAPKVSLHEGLKKTINYFSQHLKHYID